MTNLSEQLKVMIFRKKHLFEYERLKKLDVIQVDRQKLGDGR